MFELKDWASFFISLLGVFSSGAIAILVYGLNRQSHRAQVDHAIADSYNQVMHFRSEHPEVLKLSRQWSGKYFATVYTQRDAHDVQWVHYYTYVELCLGFVNNVLHARKSHLLGRESFEQHYEQLIKLMLTENEPFLSSTLPAGPYISGYIKEFRAEQEKKGWDWRQRHSKLAQSD